MLNSATMLTCDFCKIACWDLYMHVGICNMHVETRHLFLMRLYQINGSYGFCQNRFVPR
jgi:hypothetical protein